jgi:hypothetical protein
MKKPIVKKKKEKEVPPTYLVNAPYIMGRKANYRAGAKIRKAFSSVNSKDKPVEQLLETQGWYNGNVDSQMTINNKTRKLSFGDAPSFLSVPPEEYQKFERENTRLWKALPASLALYRTICMFNNPVVECEGNNGYKVPWTMHLLHTESNTVIAMREWKGGFGIGLPHYEHTKMPLSLKRDLTLLVETLVSDRSPHPYDGVVAGSVA